MVPPRPRGAAANEVLGQLKSPPSGTSQRPGEPTVEQTVDRALTLTSLSSTSPSALDLDTVLLAPSSFSSTTSSFNAPVNASNALDLNVCTVAGRLSSTAQSKVGLSPTQNQSVLGVSAEVVADRNFDEMIMAWTGTFGHFQKMSLRGKGGDRVIGTGCTRALT